MVLEPRLHICWFCGFILSKLWSWSCFTMGRTIFYHFFWFNSFMVSKWSQKSQTFPLTSFISLFPRGYLLATLTVLCHIHHLCDFLNHPWNICGQMVGFISGFCLNGHRNLQIGRRNLVGISCIRNFRDVLVFREKHLLSRTIYPKLSKSFSRLLKFSITWPCSR